jgi:cytochrome b pre-mRNA-processing protein 3
VLVTVLALTMARLERDGEDGDAVSAALTERFIEVMESEHRELGMGDPTIGKTMRRLVGSLAGRIELWRAAIHRERDWIEATRESLYRNPPHPDALEHCAEALMRLWSTLEAASLDDLKQGKLQ